MLAKTLEERRSEFTTQLSTKLQNFVDAQATQNWDKIDDAKTKVDECILDQEAGKLLDIESKQLQENLKRYFLCISNEEIAYKAFINALVQIFGTYKKEDIDDHKSTKPKSILLFQYIVDTYFPSIKTDALHPDPLKPWHKDLLQMLTRGLSFDEYKKLPLKYQDELFPRGRLVANHLFDFSFTYYHDIKSKIQLENERAQAELLSAAANASSNDNNYHSSVALAPEPTAPKVNVATAAVTRAVTYLRSRTGSNTQGAAVQDL